MQFLKEPAGRIDCFFYVLETLITPIIMGMMFLERTETPKKYWHRLQAKDNYTSKQVHSMGTPGRRLLCFADGEPVLANADTGADMDLISLTYASERQFTISPITNDFDSTVEFADGSLAELSGIVVLQVGFGSSNGGPRFNNEFFVLEGLTCDLLLGADLLDEIDAFQTYQEDFATIDGLAMASDLCPIVWFNNSENRLSSIGQRLRQGT